MAKRAKKKASPKKKARVPSGSKTRVKSPRTAEQYGALPKDLQEQFKKVARVIQKVRREKVSVTSAAKEIGIPRRKVIEFGKSALKKQSNGRYTAKSFDRLLRVLAIPSIEGRTEVAVRDSRTASKLAAYSEAVRVFVRTGNATGLREFKKLKLKDASGNVIKLLTDAKELTRLGNAGVLSFESLYVGTN
jgi:hypothetical protein